MPDTLGLLERALEQTGTLVSRVRPEQADLPTPCTDWDVRTLVNHIVFDLQTFSSMVTGDERPEPGADLIGDEWSAAYRTNSEALMHAWRERGVDGSMQLGSGEMPAVWTAGLHMSDLAVHGWDVARATGQSTDLDQELGQESLDWGRASLKPEQRSSSFGPEVKVSDSAPIYDRLAAFFGRDPAR